MQAEPGIDREVDAALAQSRDAGQVRLALVAGDGKQAYAAIRGEGRDFRDKGGDLVDLAT